MRQGATLVEPYKVSESCHHERALAREGSAFPQHANLPNFFPALNAFLNGTSAVLIGSGYYFIKKGRREAHKRMMLDRLCHLHAVPDLLPLLPPRAARRSHAFQGEGAWRPIYFSILISHTILAVVVVPFILVTLYRALKGNFVRHKAIAPYTFAIWMYVSVTGVVIYVMLYKIFVP